MFNSHIFGFIALFGGLYIIPVTLSICGAMFILRNSAAKIKGFEWNVLYAPLLIWFLLTMFAPHWSGKSLSNFIEMLYIGLLVTAITVVRSIFGFWYPEKYHVKWYLRAVFLTPFFVWFAVPGLAE
ncbi:hypothetical protein [Methylomonas sp. AM2-LC]|uniref:hypothetical protein n=1 Tax=Methylomonas sp. AM2-LC TaxID=3153301 RepID=UPI003264D7A7